MRGLDHEEISVDILKPKTRAINRQAPHQQVSTIDRTNPQRLTNGAPYSLRYQFKPRQWRLVSGRFEFGNSISSNLPGSICRTIRAQNMQVKISSIRQQIRNKPFNPCPNLHPIFLVNAKFTATIGSSCFFVCDIIF